MPATTDYLQVLKDQLRTAADAKKAALDRQYERATGATFNPTTGALSYRTDASGNPLYGTLDVDYQEQKRSINTQAEGAGMLRSGQRARNLATGEAAYRSAVTGLAEGIAAEKAGIDTERLLREAEYTAMYGNAPRSSAGGETPAAPRSTDSSPSDPQGPAAPTFTGGSGGSRQQTPTNKGTGIDRYFPSSTPRTRGPIRGPVQGPSILGPGQLVDREHQGRRPTPSKPASSKPPARPVPRTPTRRR